MMRVFLASVLVATVASAAVPNIKLNNGVLFPAIAAGTWQYNSSTAEASITEAFKEGFRHIDTAHDYCGDGTTGKCSDAVSNQGGIGLALKASGIARTDFFVTTKVPGCGSQGISRDNCAADSVAAAKRNLVELGLPRVDLLLIHFPPQGGCGALNCKVIQSQYKALQDEILAANLTRALGVSNFCVSCLECLKAGGLDAPLPPAVNQVQYHVGMGVDPGGLKTYCDKNGILLEAYSPLGDGKLVSDALTAGIGKAHGKSGVQVALRWIVQHGWAVTTKSSNPAYLADDIDIFDWQLSSAEMAQLDAATTPAGKPSFMCDK